MLLRRLHDSSQVKLVSTVARPSAPGRGDPNNSTAGEKKNLAVPVSCLSRGAVLKQGETNGEGVNKGQDTDQPSGPNKNEETSALSQAVPASYSGRQASVGSQAGREGEAEGALTAAVSSTFRPRKEGVAPRTNPWAGPQWAPEGGMGQHGTWAGSVKVTERITR